jgi:nitroimidazol reductase NimA-like FMN-containing flavoprotein (pyridoxamine 5'-phosphate oxidase superfamily)
MGEDPAARARQIVDAGYYMTLATADADGAPWASPVWYAPESAKSLLWMSAPDARHSRNIEVRPRLAISIFDSQQQPGTGHAVYIEASAAVVPDSELEAAAAIYSASSLERGASGIEPAEVRPPEPWRLYRASATRIWFGERNERTEVSLAAP